jgi:hypothetical protein
MEDQFAITTEEPLIARKCDGNILSAATVNGCCGGLTQERLAELTDLHPTDVGASSAPSAIPACAPPAKLAKGLGIQAAELFRGVHAE